MESVPPVMTSTTASISAWVMSGCDKGIIAVPPRAGWGEAGWLGLLMGGSLDAAAAGCR